MSQAQIDAHQHFWRLDRADYGWLTPALGPLYRDYLPQDLKPILDLAGVGRTVLVQAAPSVAETRFLLSLADQHPWIAGVVGWVDLAAPDAAETIAALARHPKLKGLRPMLQDLPDDEWILHDALAPALAAMCAHGLRFDALVQPRHLPVLRRFLERWPALPVVIDHGAKPHIALGRQEQWARDIAALAADFPHVHCKLSGLITEALPQAGLEDLRPYAETLLTAFGPARLMWGSDWPVVHLRCGYDHWRALSLKLTAHLSAPERAALFGETAARFYGL